MLDLNHVVVGPAARVWRNAEQFSYAEDGILPTTNRGRVDSALLTFGFSREDTVHVRSNIFEIARGFYLKNPVNLPDKFNPLKLSRLFRNSTEHLFENEFAEWSSEVSFERQHLLGFHYSDMFYWEHRMAMWLGPMLRADAFLYKTAIPLNCRGVLQNLLEVTMDDRKQASMFYHLMNLLWPEVLEVPIFSGRKWEIKHWSGRRKW